MLAAISVLNELKINISKIKSLVRRIQTLIPDIKIGTAHGKLSNKDISSIMTNFANGSIDVLVCTTIVEMGLDIPNANTMIVIDSQNFGLAQLHQLRGRVGRGQKQGVCILLFKEGLSKNAIKRIKILKNSDDGFFIAEEDLKLRGFGDLIGYQQSGIKNFKFADPLHHEDLFKLAEKYVLDIRDNINEKKYSFLLKLFDKAEIINIEEF